MKIRVASPESVPVYLELTNKLKPRLSYLVILNLPATNSNE